MLFRSLDIEPAMYIDSGTAEVGHLESVQPLGLVRRYWQQTPITPEEVGATNERIACDGPFPTLQVFPVHKHSLSTLTARLALLPGPQATLYFIYNGLPVDSDRLQDESATVRQMMDGALYELPRDHGLERQWRMRLAQLLPTATNREVWLDFMLEAIPALQADGWEVLVAADRSEERRVGKEC